MARQRVLRQRQLLGFVDYQYADPAVRTNASGVGIAGGAPAEPVGAYIEGVIDFRRGRRPLERRVLIEDMAQASTLAGGVAALMLADMNRAVTLLGMGHDRAQGEIRLEGDLPYVRWPDYDRQPDASIVPTAIGNNPLLTIAALAERIADLIVTDPDHATLFEVPPTRHDPPMQSL
jgi:hypothetical protein